MTLQRSNHDPTIRVPCTDAFHRDRAVTVWEHPGDGCHGHVVLVAPAGETARLSPEEARVLAGLLVAHAGRLEARRRPLSRPTLAPVVPLRARREGL